jgi:hypothetical protein
VKKIIWSRRNHRGCAQPHRMQSVLSELGCHAKCPRRVKAQAPHQSATAKSDFERNPQAPAQAQHQLFASPPTCRCSTPVPDAHPPAPSAVIAQVDNVTESGGTCTLSVRTAGVTKSYPNVSAESNAASTQCFPITIALNGFSRRAGRSSG